MPVDHDMNLNKPTSGDVAVSGLINGVISGIGMGVFLILGAWVSGDSPLSYLAFFSVGTNLSQTLGLIAHLAVSGIYGIIFALVWRWVSTRRRFPTVPTWLAGLVYGILLFIVARVVLLPGPAETLSAVPPLIFAMAHGVYGLSLGVASR